MDELSINKIGNMLKAFEVYALGDIKKTQQHGMPIAAFILAMCFIDQVSGYVFDNKAKGQKDNTSRSKKFVTEYLNKVASKRYNSDDLISLLRNKLVHNYSVFDAKIPDHPKYALEFTHPELHMRKDGDTIFINAQGFINDLEKAFLLYKERLRTDAELQQIALAHYEEFNILGESQRTVTFYEPL
jgi:hypothetical protein